jgi:dTDP-4-amino-4,6-dideoxygalactose transaminase
MNSGEGGFLVTDDAEVAARAVLLSGSYMFHDRHGAAPGPEAFEGLIGTTPNISGRMDSLRAAILRPQIALLDDRCAAWTERYRRVETGLRGVPGLTVIERPQEEAFVGSSIQFLLRDWPAEAIAAVVARCKARGVELKWFGAERPAGFTSRYDHWAFAAPAPMPATDRVLAGLLDMRLPLTFTLADCDLIARIIAAEVRAGQAGRAAAE